LWLKSNCVRFRCLDVCRRGYRPRARRLRAHRPRVSRSRHYFKNNMSRHIIIMIVRNTFCRCNENAATRIDCIHCF